MLTLNWPAFGALIALLGFLWSMVALFKKPVATAAPGIQQQETTRVLAALQKMFEEMTQKLRDHSEDHRTAMDRVESGLEYARDQVREIKEGHREIRADIAGVRGELGMKLNDLPEKVASRVREK